ncbi:slipin family protein [Candidatus Poribacteria bacterium]|nr:MAG: slipin family protein [Candidatus Poribacteria bacterium]
MIVYFVGGAIIVALILIYMGIKILREYERGVVFRFGKLHKVKGPGLVAIIPFVDRMVKVSLRVQTVDVEEQDVITSDNVSVKVNAVLYYRVADPASSVVEVEDPRFATTQVALTALRSVIGKFELDDLLSKRELINQELKKIVSEHVDPWGIEIVSVEIKDVDLPESMKRAMARQAEAERERRAKVISAQGEYEAAQTLMEAAKIIAENPTALQLRFLQTLMEVATESNSTILFPVPIDLLKPYIEKGKGGREG